MFPTNPSDLHVVKFCRFVARHQKPVHVVREPMFGEAESDCFAIVEEQVARLGGQRVIGWAIWELPGVFIEAEFHAVWRSPAGHLLDLTPHALSPRGCTFLADRNRSYDGRQVDNIRQPLVFDIDVFHFLILQQRRFKVLNTGELADQHGQVALSGELLAEYELIEQEQARLEPVIFSRMQRHRGPY